MHVNEFCKKSSFENVKSFSCKWKYFALDKSGQASPGIASENILKSRVQPNVTVLTLLKKLREN
jgi:hypothetical protein